MLDWSGCNTSGRLSGTAGVSAQTPTHTGPRTGIGPAYRASTRVPAGSSAFSDALTSRSALCTGSRACRRASLRLKQRAACTVQGREGDGNQAGGCVIWRETTGETCVITSPTRLKDERCLLDDSHWVQPGKKAVLLGHGLAENRHRLLLQHQPGPDSEDSTAH